MVLEVNNTFGKRRMYFLTLRDGLMKQLITLSSSITDGRQQIADPP